MIIIHGDNILDSSKRLAEISDKYKLEGQQVVTLDASSIKIETLRQELSPADLFGNTSVVVLKGLLSGSKKKETEKIISFLKETDNKNLVLYETKSVHASTLRQFKTATVESFKVSIDIFRFLEKLNPRLKADLLENYKKITQDGAEPEFIFAMVLRQLRLLIQIKSGSASLKLPAFAITKLRSQASNFTDNHLLDLHSKLYDIEVSIKTGKTQLDLKTLLHHFFLLI